MEESINISSSDYWFKAVGMLQQNWAVIEAQELGCIVYFFGDTAMVFDRIAFLNISEASDALKRNGFERFAEDKDAQKFIVKPQAPFLTQAHPEGAIYSSGRYWV